MKTLKELEEFYYNYYRCFSVMSPSPVNEPEFIAFFWDCLEYLEKDNDPDSVHFDGCGAYGGRQFSVYMAGSEILELVIHDDGKIAVYTGQHNGFWVPPFLSMEDNMLLARVKDVMAKLMGLK